MFDHTSLLLTALLLITWEEGTEVAVCVVVGRTDWRSKACLAVAVAHQTLKNPQN